MDIVKYKEFSNGLVYSLRCEDGMKKIKKDERTN